MSKFFTSSAGFFKKLVGLDFASCNQFLKAQIALKYNEIKKNMTAEGDLKRGFSWLFWQVEWTLDKFVKS